MKKSFLFVVAMSCFHYMQAQNPTETKLKFTYDASGNQTLRDLASADGGGGDGLPDEPPVVDTPEPISHLIYVSPNPTDGKVNIRWDLRHIGRVTRIELISMINSQREEVTIGPGNSASIDLSLKPSGLYVVSFHISSKTNRVVQKKIIRL